jgi:hypothetical protein
MGETTKLRERTQGLQGPVRHYHVIESAVSDPHGYRDDLFLTRRRALELARSRAHWLAAIAGCRVESLLGPPGRYLITTGRPHDTGRMVSVEQCDDAECLEGGLESTRES